MNCRNFLQFELLKPARLVRKGETPEAPPVAPAEAGKSKEEQKKTTYRPPEQNAEEKRQRNEIEDKEKAKAAAEAEKKLAETTQSDLEKLASEAKKILVENEKYGEAYTQYDEGKIDKNTFLQVIDDSASKATIQRWLDAEDAAKEKDSKEEDSDKSSDALKGMGIGALLERLVDKLTKLFDKLTVQIEKMFGSLEKKTASIKSPFGGDKKFTITRGYEEGKGLTIAANANEEIYSATSGTVTNFNSTQRTVEITKDNGDRMVYKNIEPAAGLKKGDDATKIEPGKQMVIGKAVSADGIEFQYFNKNNTEQDPTESFKKAELVEKEPEPATAAGTPGAPTAPPPAAPVAPATSVASAPPTK